VSDWVPLFPLGTVLFPDGLLPLRVFETRYVDMTREALKTKAPFGVCLIRDGKEVGTGAKPEEIGTLAHIFEADMPQMGLFTLKTRGASRFRVVESKTNSQGLLLARIDLLEPEEDAPLEPRFEPLARLVRKIVDEHQPSVFLEPYRYESSTWVSYRLTEILPIPPAAKQKMLELDDATSRLEVLLRFLEQRGLIPR
jgi:uncharacterized protein